MIDSDRLDELETYRPDDDQPLDARVSLPWRDLRDLVALIPYARELMRIAGHFRIEPAVANGEEFAELVLAKKGTER